MPSLLQGKKVAILATEGFEQSELIEPRKALDNEGALTVVVSPMKGFIRGWNANDWGQSVRVDQDLDIANAADYDALLLPGGVMNPDKLRTIEKAVLFVKAFFAAGKPVAAICHGPWTIVEADLVRGRKLTSWPSLKTDIRNAGGEWVDEEVVTDHGFVTSRKPADIPAFSMKFIEEIYEGRHTEQQTLSAHSTL